jgi:hypothetical protein
MNFIILICIYKRETIPGINRTGKEIKSIRIKFKKEHLQIYRGIP